MTFLATFQNLSGFPTECLIGGGGTAVANGKLALHANDAGAMMGTSLIQRASLTVVEDPLRTDFCACWDIDFPGLVADQLSGGGLISDVCAGAFGGLGLVAAPSLFPDFRLFATSDGIAQVFLPTGIPVAMSGRHGFRLCYDSSVPFQVTGAIDLTPFSVAVDPANFPTTPLPATLIDQTFQPALGFTTFTEGFCVQLRGGRESAPSTRPAIPARLSPTGHHKIGIDPR